MEEAQQGVLWLQPSLRTSVFWCLKEGVFLSPTPMFHFWRTSTLHWPTFHQLQLLSTSFQLMESTIQGQGSWEVEVLSMLASTLEQTQGNFFLIHFHFSLNDMQTYFGLNYIHFFYYSFLSGQNLNATYQNDKLKRKTTNSQINIKRHKQSPKKEKRWDNWLNLNLSSIYFWQLSHSQLSLSNKSNTTLKKK